MLTILIGLLIIIACGYGAFWFIDKGVPAEIQWIANLIVAILGLIAIYYLFASYGHLPIVS